MEKKNGSQYYGSQCGPETVWLPTFFKTSYLMLSMVAERAQRAATSENTCK